MVLQSLPLNGVPCYNTADSIYSLRWTAFFFPYVYLWVYVCRHMCMWRLKNSLWESLIPCHHMGLKDHTWYQTRLQLSHLLTHLTGSKTVFSYSQWHCFEHPCICFLVRHPRTFSGDNWNHWVWKCCNRLPLCIMGALYFFLLFGGFACTLSRYMSHVIPQLFRGLKSSGGRCRSSMAAVIADLYFFFL